MYSDGRPAGPFDGLGNVHGVDRIRGAAQADSAVTGVGRRRPRRTPLCGRRGRDRGANTRALGLLRNIAHRAAEVDVDYADVKLVRQSLANGGQRLRVVVPNLHCQRSRLVLDSPEPLRQFAAPGVDAQESARLTISVAGSPTPPSLRIT